MSWRERPARSILRLQGSTDPWFVTRYGMNLYRGCQHGCWYCDGRAEKYRVEGDFARDIAVKSNALELLERELSRLPEPGFLFLGGGVSDSWQPAEARYGLARGALELALERGLPVHLLTKSALAERDLDLLAAVDERSRAIVACSIMTTDEGIRERYEPGAAPIEARWALLRRAKALGLATGLMAMPVLPGISDQPEAIDALLGRAAGEGVDFALCGGLTLRPGIQKQALLEQVRCHHPDLLPGYEQVYQQERPSGGADGRYYRRLELRFFEAMQRHRLAGRLPRPLFTGLLPQYSEVAVLLEHREHELSAQRQRAPWLGRSGIALQGWARAELSALRRRRRPGAWQQLEQRFRERVERGSLAGIEGLDARALPEIEALVSTLPAPRGQAQLGLL